MQNIHVLTVGAEVDKHAALTAVTTTVHDTGQPVVALPATGQAIADAKDGARRRRCSPY